MLIAGVVFATGLAIYFYAGRKSNSHRPVKGLSEFRLPGGHVTPAVCKGGTHGIILAPDGSLWAWGENYDGWSVLGLGGITNQTSLHRVGNETDWASIAVSWHHNLAIKSDGTLWGWGENVYGQLGDGTSGRPNSQRTTPVASAPGNDWKQVAAGGSHSLALKKDGTLWGWGNNWAGQLGIGMFSPEEPDAVQVGAATNWVKVWAGLLETVAQKADGTLWYWGDNPNPAIPQSGPTSTNICNPTLVSADTNWVDVGFGPWTVLAIKSDGTLWSWGRQAYAFTGVENQSACAVPRQVGTNNDWKAICRFGWQYQILLKKDGSVWSLSAEMGPAPKPLRMAQVKVPNGVVAFDGSGSRVPMGVVITRQGEVWTWGRVLGENTAGNGLLQLLAKLARQAHYDVEWGKSQPVSRGDIWQLTGDEPFAEKAP
jgi:alpha-tubulin suppressor-like RCC1 family protein